MVPPTVLLAESEPNLRPLLARWLGSLGFAVLAAADGREALALASTSAGPIHLLVTDVEMPGLTGGDLVRGLGVERAETAVLFVSERPPSRAVADAVVGRTAAFLAKPFTLEALRAAVVDLVGAVPAASGRPSPPRAGRQGPRG